MRLIHNKTFICDECRARLSNKSLYFCAECTYCLCTECEVDMETRQLPGELPITCDAGHELHRYRRVYSDNRYSCNLCSKVFDNRINIAFNCNKCDYDVCTNCQQLAQGLDQVNRATQMLKLAALFSLLEWQFVVHIYDIATSIVGSRWSAGCLALLPKDRHLK